MAFQVPGNTAPTSFPLVKMLLLALTALVIAGGAYFLLSSPSTPARTAPVKIVAFGDSLTAGYGVDEQDSYPSQLKRALSDYTIDMVNLGVSGDTTEDAKHRVQQVIDEQSDIVLLGIGGNDALRLMPVNQAKANIESIIRTLKGSANPPRIILLKMKASINGGLSYKNEFDAIYEDIAKKHNVPLVPFVITKIYLDAKYVLSDRIHMNAEGYSYVIREYLKEAVEDEIRKLK